MHLYLYMDVFIYIFIYFCEDTNKHLYIMKSYTFAPPYILMFSLIDKCCFP